MARARVLLLEDDPALLAVLRELFEDEELDVTVCSSLAEIQRGVVAFPGAIVVSDSWDGTDQQTLGPTQRGEILALSETAPVILATGRAWAHDHEQNALGSAVVVAKPYDLDALMATVRAALGRA